MDSWERKGREWELQKESRFWIFCVFAPQLYCYTTSKPGDARNGQRVGEG